MEISLFQELKRKHMIDQLNELGIVEYEGKHVSELDYYTIRKILTVTKSVSDAQEWDIKHFSCSGNRKVPEHEKMAHKAK